MKSPKTQLPQTAWCGLALPCAKKPLSSLPIGKIKFLIKVLHKNTLDCLSCDHQTQLTKRLSSVEIYNFWGVRILRFLGHLDDDRTLSLCQDIDDRSDFPWVFQSIVTQAHLVSTRSGH